MHYIRDQKSKIYSLTRNWHSMYQVLLHPCIISISRNQKSTTSVRIRIQRIRPSSIYALYSWPEIKNLLSHSELAFNVSGSPPSMHNIHRQKSEIYSLTRNWHSTYQVLLQPCIISIGRNQKSTPSVGIGIRHNGMLSTLALNTPISISFSIMFLMFWFP
jgi:hypothetical protein